MAAKGREELGLGELERFWQEERNPVGRRLLRPLAQQVWSPTSSIITTGNLLEMHIPRPYPGPVESESLRGRVCVCVCVTVVFNQLSR